MANRQMTANELAEYAVVDGWRTMAALNRGNDIVAPGEEDVEVMVKLAIRRTRIKALTASTLEVDDSTGEPSGETVGSLT